MVVSRMTKMLFAVSFLLSLSTQNAFSSIDTHAMNAVGSAQMVSLNLQYKTKNKVVKSNLMMPFYQTAELERQIGDKNVLIEINPKRGKLANEVALEMKFYNSAGSKAFLKKEVVAKLNEDAHFKFRGQTLKIRPVIN